MAELPQGYHDISEEDTKKAKVFFDRGDKVAGTGNFDYAIEMYLQGLAIDPDAKEAHQTLREIAIKRKASGGKDLGFFEKMQLRRGGKDDIDTMLKTERLMCYDPGNTDNMLLLFKAAHKGGFYDTVMWVGAVLLKGNSDLKKPDIDKYLAMRDVYIELKRWQQAIDASQAAVNLRPDDMELQRILKDLGATHTLQQGNYEEGGSFRDSIRDMGKQKRLMQADMDIHDVDVMASQIKDAEADVAADPNDVSKTVKLVDALVKTETMENENRAIEILEKLYEKTKQFRFRFNIGKIYIGQLRRQDRTERIRLKELALSLKDSKDPAAQATQERAVAQYTQFFCEKTQKELSEFRLFSENYPTDISFKYEIGVRLFLLEQFQEAIAVFQQARQDPKQRVEASTYLGRAFLQCGFTDEACDTLKQSIEEYEIRGDNRSKALFYWYGLALEKKGDTASAAKAYSQLMQWDYNYRDVQERLKRTRTHTSATTAGETNAQ